MTYPAPWKPGPPPCPTCKAPEGHRLTLTKPDDEIDPKALRLDDSRGQTWLICERDPFPAERLKARMGEATGLIPVEKADPFACPRRHHWAKPCEVCGWADVDWKGPGRRFGDRGDVPRLPPPATAGQAEPIPDMKAPIVGKAAGWIF